MTSPDNTDGTATTDIKSIPVHALDGSDIDLAEFSGPLLIVNVASKCGLTPQYTALEKLAEDYRDRGLTVLGAPCNQFMGQEPGSTEEIAEFCSATYGVTFPLTEKLNVNGEDAHPLFAELTKTPDTDGKAGDVEWNFEKFLVSKDGEVLARFRPATVPDAPEVIDAVEAAL
ncbi:glutathione peroxidase [Corynebacterium sp. USCH3]|uniref:glutathione peroxidase n=1 Tax=Corynebacterium sp. USCH3 TaxID=3024840 RepID=UPI003095B125